MRPVRIETPRLVLDLPTLADAEDVHRYCQDPVFERYMTLPWPYRKSDAEAFLDDMVPSGWANGREFTWAVREHDAGLLLGVVGSRVQPQPGVVDVGYWLGAPHRGRGYMVEAVIGVVDWLVSAAHASEVLWECLVDNTDSARVARAAGFRFTGEAPLRVATRDGSHPPAWHGILSARDHDGGADAMGNAAQTWPAETVAPSPSNS